MKEWCLKIELISNNKWLYTPCKINFGPKTLDPPDEMVLICISTSCKWKIYVIKIKNIEKYQIRRVNLEHSCSVDERACITHIYN